MQIASLFFSGMAGAQDPVGHMDTKTMKSQSDVHLLDEKLKAGVAPSGGFSKMTAYFYYIKINTYFLRM